MRFDSSGLKALLGLLLSAVMVSAHAAYPEKPVRLVVSYPAGGPTDVLARSLAQKLSQNTGGSFIVDNRGGGGGNIGAQLVARAPADGYTLLFLVVGHTINMALYEKPGFSIDADLVPIVPVASSPLILLANAAQPFTTVKGMLDAVKREPRKYSYGSAGSGSAPHLAMELLKREAGIEMVHVPFKGGGPALTAAMAGDVQVMFDSMVTGLRAGDSGKVRPLGISSEQRSAAAPQLPTIAEAGVPGFKAITWYGLAAPKGTPADIVEKVNAEVTRILKEPATREEYARVGADPMLMTAGEFKRFVDDEQKRWRGIVKAVGATAD